MIVRIIILFEVIEKKYKRKSCYIWKIY